MLDLLPHRAREIRRVLGSLRRHFGRVTSQFAWKSFVEFGVFGVFGGEVGGGAGRVGQRKEVMSNRYSYV